jgi:hypothetical protein
MLDAGAKSPERTRKRIWLPAPDGKFSLFHARGLAQGTHPRRLVAASRESSKLTASAGRHGDFMSSTDLYPRVCQEANVAEIAMSEVLKELQKITNKSRLQMKFDSGRTRQWAVEPGGRANIIDVSENSLSAPS